jgi:fibronectin-binding autotransporter adhesin
MAQSYTRQSTFSDGDTITASLFNNEYNQLLNAFSYSSSSATTTGHRHDGTAGEGGNIHTIGDLDFLNKIVVDSTNNRWGVYVEVSGSAVEQVRIQDGAIVPVTDNDIDLGTSSLEFKDLYLDGTATIDTLAVDANATVAGTLGVTGATTLSSTLGVTGATTLSSTLGVTGATTLSSTLAVTGTSTLTGNVTTTNDLSVGGNLTVTGNATISGNLTFGDAATDTVTLSADVASSILPSTDDTFDLGATGSEWRDLYIDGTANIDSLVADTADINAGTIDNTAIGGSTASSGAFTTLSASGATTLSTTLGVTGATTLSSTLAVTGAATLSSTLGVTGESTLASAIVSDLTSGRVVLAGTSGAIEDSGNLTFDGTTLAVTGAATVSTDLTVNGNTTLGNAASDTVTVTADVASNLIPSADSTYSLGDSSNYWSNGYIDAVTTTGDVSVGGNLTVTGNATISGNLTFGDAATDTVSFSADVSSNLLPSADNTYDLGASGSEWKDLYIDGTAYVDAIDFNGTALTVTGTELNIMDGDTAATSTTLADADRVVVNDAGTMKQVALTDFETYFESALDTLSNVTTVGTIGSGVWQGTAIADAYVANDLTISGGTVDNSVIGGSTPAAGTFTTLTANTSITGTLATAAQTNVTSLGTLSSLAVSGDLTVDTSTLKVDSTNNRVGILNTSPDVTLDIGSATDAVHVPVGTTAQRPGSPAAGYFRYNTSLSQFEGYTDAWGAIGGGGTNTFTHDSFTGDASTTAFTLSQSTESENNLIVFVDGVFQTQDAYSISTTAGVTTLTMSAAPASGRKIVVYTVAAGVSGSNLNIDTMTGDGSDTTLTLSINPVNENNTQVFIDGVYQSKSNYSISGTTLTFSTAPPNGSSVEVMTMTQTDINVPVDGTITSAKLSGDLTLPGDLSFADNNKAIFGAGSDLQIYHDVSNNHTFVKESGSGNLYVQANNLRLQSASGGNYAQGIDGDAFKLYFNDAEKLATTSTGIDVTGTVTADGLTVQTTNGFSSLFESSISYQYLQFKNSGETNNYIGFINDDFVVTPANNQKMIVTAEGNVGIGTSSPQQLLHINGGAADTALQITNSASGSTATDGFSITVENPTPDVVLRNRESSNMRFLTANTERMRIDSSGNVGIGGAPDSWSSSSTALQLGSLALEDFTVSGANVSNILNNAYRNTSGNIVYKESDFASAYTQYNGEHKFQVAASGTAGNTISFTEAMRIDSSRNLLVGCTSQPDASNFGGFINPVGQFRSSRNNTGASTQFSFNNPNGEVGTIVTNGSTTSYNTSSDHRLKENIIDAPSASNDIDAIQVRSFDWKVDGSHQKYGMVAQELVTVAPEAVSQPEDPEEMMGVDYSKLVPMMLKEIQQLRARVAQLEGAN